MAGKRIRGDINNLVLGVNWGGIESKGWFGIVTYQKADIDFYIVVVSKKEFRKKEISLDQMDIYNFNRQEGEGIRMSFDDNSGDIDGDDLKDNEYAILDLSEIDNDSILIPVIVKYSDLYQWRDFSHLEFSRYSGEPNVNRDNIHDLKTINIDDKDICCLGVISSERGKWYFENNVKGLSNKLKKLKDYSNIF